MSIDPRQTFVKVRIKNVKSGRYLSLQDGPDRWMNNDNSLCIRDLMGPEVQPLENPQVWNIFQHRKNAWKIQNQFSSHIACIRGRETGNNATAIQHHNEGLVFQEWNFKPLPNGNWLIQNNNSGKFIGPQGRSTNHHQHCIQYDDQTKEDNYQEWVFESVAPGAQKGKRLYASHPIPQVIRRLEPKGELPEGMQFGAAAGPTNLEPAHIHLVVGLGSFVIWPLSYLDNRMSVALVVYDSNKNIINIVEKPGARFVHNVTVNNADHSVTFWGESNHSVMLTLAEMLNMLVPQ